MENFFIYNYKMSSHGFLAGYFGSLTWFLVLGIVLAVVAHKYPSAFGGYLKPFSIYGSVVAFLLFAYLVYLASH
jgi:hypothetical protein